MYKDAGVVIARSGRNVVSELLFLNIGGILFATDGVIFVIKSNSRFWQGIIF